MAYQVAPGCKTVAEGDSSVGGDLEFAFGLAMGDGQGWGRSATRLMAIVPEYDPKYASWMERVTATLEAETLKRIRRVAGPRGVSRFLSIAARERLARLELLGLLDDLDARHGQVDPSVNAEVARDARRIFRR